MEQQSSAIEIFCCYAHEDENLLNEVGLGSLRKSITSILSYEWFLQ
jgi:hypothetical protein